MDTPRCINNLNNVSVDWEFHHPGFYSKFGGLRDADRTDFAAVPGFAYRSPVAAKAIAHKI
ncbi:hypothetical protein NG796_04680 [Laspinema sp. A4]|nr:hypothetical protein [Laspinema sp. D2d]